MHMDETTNPPTQFTSPDPDASGWPVDRKIDYATSTAWESWASFVGDTPELGEALLVALPHDIPQDRDLAVLAIWYWIKAGETVDCGTGAEIGRGEDGSLDIRWYPSGKPSRMLWGNKDMQWMPLTLAEDIEPIQAPHKDITQSFRWERPLDHDELADLSPASRALALNFERIMRAERAWLQECVEAPVAKATFQGQGDTDRGDVYNIDGAMFDWDASVDIFQAPVCNRNEMMERDQYSSDALRESDYAAGEAQNWDGPYWVDACLYPPSPELRALRQAKALTAKTLAVSNNSLRPRL